MKLSFTSTTLVALLFPIALYAQQQATIKETTRTYTTYPFSDPDPVPLTGKLYPYFRFDGFTDQPVEKAWKVVELENDYIKVQVMPEIGGKIWYAYDKKEKKDFIYNNGVVKFRDIAMRGPWTSGGIEANFGIIGHTPNTSTPVDYLTRQNPDGSASCFISTLDLLTRTRWVLEIKLEKDKGYFSTHVFWSNSNPVEQPYYSWMNLGIPAADDLRFVYPGDHYIGHDGESHDWPIDEEGRDLSEYKQNNFGPSKSYHVLGARSDFFGAYWQKDDYGMVRFAKREDKLGKKIFLWAQSDEGKIWEQLLTDHSGQYVEIQSGRLFNQNMFQSSFTPFKQVGFEPYQADSWTEYWYPFKGIGIFDATNLLGSFRVEQQGNTLRVKLSAIQPIADTLQVYDAGKALVGSAYVQASPGETVNWQLSLASSAPVQALCLKKIMVDLHETAKKNSLTRPLRVAKEMDASSAYGLYLQGRDLNRFREYTAAEPKIEQALALAPTFIPALMEKTKLELFHMRYDSAFYYAKKALSIDAYDSEANYYYGLAALKLGQIYDAKDGFEVAALTPAFRGAAHTALSSLYLQLGDITRALDYAEQTLIDQGNNVAALQLQYLSARLLGFDDKIKTVREHILALDPLNPFIRFEEYFQHPSADAAKKFTALIRNEMPVETYLELAIWYSNNQQEKAAQAVLDLAPQNLEVYYWKAWLSRGNGAEKDKWLKLAAAASADQVFPFREESASVFAWAMGEDTNWKSRYALALIHAFRNNKEKALELLNGVQSVPFAPFYVYRAQFYPQQEERRVEQDLREAVRIDRQEWRYGRLLAKFLVLHKRYPEAIQVLETYYQAEPENYVIGLDYIHGLLLDKRYALAEKQLDKIHILPFEGATDGHRYYEQAKLLLALNALKAGKYKFAEEKLAEAKEWPLRLGVGEPYPDEKDTRMIDWTTAMLYREQGKGDAYRQQLMRIAERQQNASGLMAVLQIAALQALDREIEAQRLKEALAAHLDENGQRLCQRAFKEGAAFDLASLIEELLKQGDKRLF